MRRFFKPMYSKPDIGEGESPTKDGITFVPHITLGNLLTIVAFIFTALTQWFTYDKRLTLVERTAVEHGRIIQQMSENQASTIRSQDKLLFMFQEFQKQNSWGKQAR